MLLSFVRDKQSTRVKCWSISVCAGFVHRTSTLWLPQIPGVQLLPAFPGRPRGGKTEPLAHHLADDVVLEGCSMWCPGASSLILLC